MNDGFMNDADLLKCLAHSVEHVLETMCFSIPSPVPGRAPGTNSPSVNIAFDGSHSGLLELTLDPAAARHLAVQFLGRDEMGKEPVSALEIDGTIHELGKVICGHLLSGLDPNGKVTISPRNTPKSTPLQALEQTFGVPAGYLQVSIRFN